MTFDALAKTYDDDFTNSPIARYLRGRVHDRLDTHFHRADTILELGCGTGEDALYLAQRGLNVTATDASALMLEIAAHKTEHTGRVTTRLMNLVDLPAITPVYAGAFSNFGAINVLPKWRPLAKWLKDRVKPGGIVAFGVLSRACLWEIAWHSAHGDFRTAFRRSRGTAVFQPAPTSAAIPIYYPTIEQLEAAFAPYFRRVYVEPLGFFLPPSDAYGVIEKRPRLLDKLLALEKKFGHQRLLANFADHYWIEFKHQ